MKKCKFGKFWTSSRVSVILLRVVSRHMLTTRPLSNMYRYFWSSGPWFGSSATKYSATKKRQFAYFGTFCGLILCHFYCNVIHERRTHGHDLYSYSLIYFINDNKFWFVIPPASSIHCLRRSFLFHVNRIPHKRKNISLCSKRTNMDLAF